MGKYLALAVLSYSALSVSSASESDEISYEKRALVDELSISQGDIFVDQTLAEGITDEIREYLKIANIEVDEDFFLTFSGVVQDLIHQEFILSGELQKLSYEIWEDRFEVDELKQLIKFYNSPLGIKLLKVMPEITQMSQKRSLELSQRIMPVVSYQLEKQLTEAGIDPSVLNPNSVLRTEDKNQPTEQQLSELTQAICSGNKHSDKTLPVYRGPPTYPYFARLFSIDGWVELSYVVAADGRTSRVRVGETSTGSLFNEPAIDAVLRYRYCASDSASDQKIRIVFKMDQNKNTDTGSIDKARKSEGIESGLELYDFAKSKGFKKEMKQYHSFESRKALALAADASDNWVVHWSHRHRTQSNANAAALAGCNTSKERNRIKSVCKILMIGDQLAEAFQPSKALRKLAKSSLKGYQPKSDYERMFEDYKGKPEPKALAFVENPGGAYHYYHASNHESQQSANTNALENCNKTKEDYLEGDCRLYMIGDYQPESVPRLNLMRGFWEGKLKVSETVVAPEVEEHSSISIRLDNCGGFPIIHTGNSDAEGFKPIARILQVSEKAGNAVLLSVVDGKDWVETQLWTLIELSENEAAIQWNRMVSNVTLKLGDDEREFGFLGSGRLTKLDGHCEVNQ